MAVMRETPISVRHSVSETESLSAIPRDSHGISITHSATCHDSKSLSAINKIWRIRLIAWISSSGKMGFIVLFPFVTTGSCCVGQSV